MTILKKAPVGANVLDFKEARAARAEARALAGVSAPFLKLNAGFVELKPELDLRASDDLDRGDLVSALGKMLADPADVDALLAEGLSGEDLGSISKHVAGLSLGELPA